MLEQVSPTDLAPSFSPNKIAPRSAGWRCRRPTLMYLGVCFLPLAVGVDGGIEAAARAGEVNDSAPLNAPRSSLVQAVNPCLLKVVQFERLAIGMSSIHHARPSGPPRSNIVREAGDGVASPR